MPIQFDQVSYIYSSNTPFAHEALNEVNCTIEDGAFTAIIGQTGSGKSTLVQHLNALLIPTKGTVTVGDKTIVAGKDNKNLKALRAKVGLVFQFPEYQLFEETVLKDISFGPKNFGATEEEAVQKAKHAMRMVGLDATYEERSPLELSGGQKRRVAIAGILAMDPAVLVLDEPTAGLDPKGARTMMELFSMLNRKYGKTIIMVSHDMEQVYRYCDSVMVMQDGKVKMHCTVKEFFKDGSICESMGILPPSIIRLQDQLKQYGFVFDETYSDINTLAKVVAKQVKQHG